MARTPAALLVCFCFGLLWQSASHAGQQAPPISAKNLVGTWTLVTTESLDVEGGRTPVPMPRGVLVYDAAGHVLEVVTRLNRMPYAGAQATPAEAQAAYASYGGLFGTYRLDEAHGKISYHVDGSVNPNVMGHDEVRSYELAPNRLTITSVRPEPGAPGGMRWVWERIPNLETLSPAHRRLVGFWQWVSERRVGNDGAVIGETIRGPSTIVYTPAGYVGVHFTQRDRKAFAADLPTDDEAKTAMTGYVGYYGVYGLFPGAVFHFRLGVLTPPGQVGDTYQRFYEISGSQITLRFPPTIVQGQEARNVVTLRQISGEADMLGR